MKIRLLFYFAGTFLGRTFCATKAELRWLQTVDFSFKSPPTYVKLLETLSQLPAYLMCEENSRLVWCEAGLKISIISFTGLPFSAARNPAPRKHFFAFHIKNYFFALYFVTLGRIRQSFFNNILIKLCGFELCVYVLPASHPFV